MLSASEEKVVWKWSFGVVSHEAGLFLWIPLSVCGPLHKEVGWGGGQA